REFSRPAGETWPDGACGASTSRLVPRHSLGQKRQLLPPSSGSASFVPMQSPSSFRGPVFMILSTGSYIVNDTLMKLATGGVPPSDGLFLPCAAGHLWGPPPPFLFRYGAPVASLAER